MDGVGGELSKLLAVSYVNVTLRYGLGKWFMEYAS